MLESPLDNKEIKPANPQGNQPWIFIGRTDSEAEAPILCDEKIQLIGNAPDAGKDWGQEEKGWQGVRWLDGITDSMDMGLGRLRQLGIDREGWRAAFHGVAKSQTRLSDWTKSFDKFSPHLWPHLLALLPSWLYIKASQPYKNLKGLSFICNLVLLHLSHKSPTEDYHKTLLSLLYYLLLIWALLEKKNLQTCMHFMQLHLWSQFSITPLPSLLSFPFLLLPLA